MRRWLQQALAEQTGICANLRFLTPGEYVDLALDANLGPAPAADRLEPDTLRWHALRELQRNPPAGASTLPRRDPTRARPGRSPTRSPTPMRSTRPGGATGCSPGNGARPRTIGKRRCGAPSPATRRIARGASAISSNASAPKATTHRRGLPPRLFVFACQNVSPDVLQVIASQARAGTQHFFLHAPARGFWGDLERWSAYTPTTDEAYLAAGDTPPNPLLAAWGQAGRDFIAMLVGGEIASPAFDVAPFVEPARDTLLGRMQADLLDNRAPLHDSNEAAWPRQQVDVRDASLQFHACHTRLREVQVLHDQLRALLESQPDLATARHRRARARHRCVRAAHRSGLRRARSARNASCRTRSPTRARSRVRRSPKRSCACSNCRCTRRRSPICSTCSPFPPSPRASGWKTPTACACRIGSRTRARAGAWTPADRTRHGADGDAFTIEFAIDRLLLGYASGGGRRHRRRRALAGTRRASRRSARRVAALRGDVARHALAPRRPASACRLGDGLASFARRSLRTRARQQRCRDPAPACAMPSVASPKARRARNTTRRSNTRSCSNNCATNSGKPTHARRSSPAASASAAWCRCG
jgi:exodeoxyribonuclease V gamma subunit